MIFRPFEVLRESVSLSNPLSKLKSHLSSPISVYDRLPESDEIMDSIIKGKTNKGRTVQHNDDDDHLL